MFDFSAMYDEVYGVIGVSATLSTGTAGEIALTVIDDTRPKTNTSGIAEVRSVGPGAFARIPELTEKGIARDDYMDAVMTFNGRTWAVRSYELRGSPTGEDVGEVRFLLKAIASIVDGGPDDWVPDNAKIHIDLVGGGRAWVDGTGEVAVDTLLGSDPNTVNAWGDTEYDPASLSSDGYSSSNAVALIGSARTMFLAGATARLAMKETAGTDNSTFAMVSENGMDAVTIDINAGGAQEVQAYSWGGPLNGSENQIPNILNVGMGAVNVVAATVTATRIDIAANESAALAAVLSSTDRPPGNPMVAAFLDTGGETVTSLTLYDPLPDTTGLSELSTDG